MLVHLTLLMQILRMRSKILYIYIMSSSLYPVSPAPISSLVAMILLVYTRNRDLWAKLKAHQKDGQLWLAVQKFFISFKIPNGRKNQTGTRNFESPRVVAFPTLWSRGSRLCEWDCILGSLGKQSTLESSRILSYDCLKYRLLKAYSKSLFDLLGDM